MQSENISFKGAFGDQLSARLDRPDGDEIKGWVLFAHGFSIGKDLKPIRTISKALVEEGYGMLRFDFTGLGQSEGNFSDTNFSSNVADILAAAKYLRENEMPPCILLGHSFGGTASRMRFRNAKRSRQSAHLATPHISFTNSLIKSRKLKKRGRRKSF